MRFYTQPHPFDCGIDLHTRSMYVCILSHDGERRATPHPFPLTPKRKLWPVRSSG